MSDLSQTATSTVSATAGFSSVSKATNASMITQCPCDLKVVAKIAHPLQSIVIWIINLVSAKKTKKRVTTGK